jgi:hypothetical protein
LLFRHNPNKTTKAHVPIGCLTVKRSNLDNYS